MVRVVSLIELQEQSVFMGIIDELTVQSTYRTSREERCESGSEIIGIPELDNVPLTIVV